MSTHKGGVRRGHGDTAGRLGGLAPPVVLALLAIIACGAKPELAEWTLDLDDTLVLGGEDAPPETAFYEPMSVRFDGFGNAYVLDSGNHRVQVLSPDGVLLASLGAAGEGPGDLLRPEGMWVFPDGEVMVADTGNARLQRFGAGRQPLDSIALDFLPLDVVGSPSHIWVLRLPPASFVLGPDPSPLVVALDRDGNRQGGFVAPRPATTGLLYFISNALRIAPGPDGGFAVADTHVYSRIRRYDRDGQPAAETAVLYKADALAPLGRLPKALSDESLARVARTASDLAWDPGRGLYWLLSGYTDRRQDGTWEVARELYRYAPDGTYRGSIMLPFEARRVAPAPDGAVWVLGADGRLHRMQLSDPDTAPRAP